VLRFLKGTFMKYFILLTIISNIFISTYTQASQPTTAIYCDYCSAQGKEVNALSSAFMNGQKIWVIDQQGTDFIIEEYRAVQQSSGDISQVDDFYVELISTHHKSSALSKAVSNAIIAMRNAMISIDESISHIQLPADDEFQSAFQIASFHKQFSGQMSDRIMNDSHIKQQFDIIDAQMQQLQANLSISLPFIGTSLNLSSQIRVMFNDGTSAEMTVTLTTSNGKNVKIVLSLTQARDKEGNIIPDVSSGLASYRSGEILNAGNTGHMGHFADWWHQLEVRGVKVISNGGGARGGSTSIKDCHYVVEKKFNGETFAKLICS
jgi:hypothetical protein